jgi:PPOX class probable F420-dependent enzyme
MPCPLQLGKTIGNEPGLPQDRPMLNDTQRCFVETRRVGHLATADAGGMPYLVPVCFGLAEATLYITIDEKPKRRGAPLKRVRNILENPSAAFIVDRYDEDWARLGWVMLRGSADILYEGDEHAAAQALIVARYPQLQAMTIADLPVIALRIMHVASWGDLSAN